MKIRSLIHLTFLSILVLPYDCAFCMKHNREDESSEENSEKTKKKAKKQSPLCEAIQSGNQAQIEASLAALQNLYKPIQIMV